MSKGMTIMLPKSEQDKFRAWVKQQTAKNKAECQNIVMDAGQQMRRYATDRIYGQVFNAHGWLLDSIKTVESSDRLGVMVYSSVDYAPYVEFGTGKKVRVYPGYEAYAWQFKGRGIREVNLRARPFFINSYEQTKKMMLKKLNKLGFK